MIYYANDKYSGVLSSGYTVGQSTLYVSAVPDNVPTVIVAAKGTDNETIFEVTDKTSNSLTGVSRLRGANVDLDAQTPLTCLNNQEFINQFERATGAEVNEGTDPAKIVTPKAIADSKVLRSNKAWDGWIEAGETWTRTGNFTFTITGDVRPKYPKGTKIRYKDGGAYEYGTVVSATYSSPNTTVTLATNADYAMAAGAITDNYYSYAENPQGFPGTFNWTSTLGTQAGTWAGAVLRAKFAIRGDNVLFNITVVGDLSVATSDYLTFTGPVTPLGTAAEQGGSASCIDVSTRAGGWQHQGSNVFRVYKFDLSDFTQSSVGFRITGHYQY